MLHAAALCLLLAGSGHSRTAGAHVNPWPEPAARHPRPDAARSRSVRVGTLTLTRCADAPAYCGDVARPLDPRGEVSGVVNIHFEFYPRQDRAPSAGTLVATEGGPGYPATLSRDDYLALFKPLMRQRDVIIMDNRGTGRSGAIDCPMLQTAAAWTVDAVAACGAALGSRAALYGTALAADDLAAILEALGVGPIDLYGDSYGTYFEQAFAVQHPAMLHAILLDGAYPLTGRDYGWYPSYAPAMRDKFNLACARSAACAAVPGTSLQHIAPALESLRQSPFSASAHDVDGRERRFRADPSSLAIVMFGSAPAYTSVRELDAAARAFADGDRVPLLRLMAETAAAVDSRDPGAHAEKWSAGLAAAVMCQDPPQIFDMRLSPDERVQARDRALAARRATAPDTYAPFTIDEYRGMPLDYSFLDLCVRWPVSPPSHPAGQVGLHGIYPDVPALILSGEFDNLTTPADGAAVAAAFPRGVQVRLANSFHVNALPRARSGCGAAIARRFLASGVPGDTACASAIPAVRLVGAFARQSRQLDAAQALAGNAATPAQLRIVAAAAATAADVLARIDSNDSGQGRGLRGGLFRIHRGPSDIEVTLERVRFTEDVRVSGWLRRPAVRGGTVRARLRAEPDSGPAGELTLSWPADAEPQGHGAAPWALIRGDFGGVPVAARLAAP